VINGSTCNASDRLGCGQTPAVVQVADSGDGNSALNIAVNAATNTVYATNVIDGEIGGSVSVINGDRCNGSNTSGCDQTPAKDAVGNYPASIAVDDAISTAYVSNVEGTVSVIPVSH
jgi:DNA-binding beta-propeller fold protein YncE